MSPAIQKLLWRSRRGMLELDILLRGYLIQYGEKLNEQQLDLFESMLELQDQTLFDAYAGKRELENELHQQLLLRIMQLSSSKS